MGSARRLIAAKHCAGRTCVVRSVGVSASIGIDIGTSVTNSLVSHGHVVNQTEFRLGFQGACAHSSFNLLCVLVLAAAVTAEKKHCVR